MVEEMRVRKPWWRGPEAMSGGGERVLGGRWGVGEWRERGGGLLLTAEVDVEFPVDFEEGFQEGELVG